MSEQLEAMLAEIVDLHGEFGCAPFLAYVDYHGVESATVEEFTDTYRGEYAHLRELAEELLVDSGMLDSLSEADLELGGDIYTVSAPSGRVYVFWTL